MFVKNTHLARLLAISHAYALNVTRVRCPEAVPSPHTAVEAAVSVPLLGLSESPPGSSASPGAYGCHLTPPAASLHGSDRWTAHTLAPMHQYTQAVLKCIYCITNPPCILTYFLPATHIL